MPGERRGEGPDKVVNLRMARKRRARSEREAEAEANRAAHSVPGRERARLRAVEERRQSAIDAHRREPER